MACFDVFRSEKVARHAGARYSLALQKAFRYDAPKTIGAARRTSVDVSSNATTVPFVARFSTSEDELGLCDVLARKLERMTSMRSKTNPNESAEGLRLPRKQNKNRRFQKTWIGTFCKANNAKGFSPLMIPDITSTPSRPSSQRGSGVNKVSKLCTTSPSTFSSLLCLSSIEVDPSPRNRRSLDSTKNGSMCFDTSPMSWSRVEVDPSPKSWSGVEVEPSPKSCRSFNSSRNGSICLEEVSVRSSIASSPSNCFVSFNDVVDSQSLCSSPHHSASISEGEHRKHRRRCETNSFDCTCCVPLMPAMIESPALARSKGFLPSFRIKQSRHEWSTCSTSTCST